MRISCRAVSKKPRRTHVKDRSDIGYLRVKLQRDFIATPVAAVADHGFGSSDLDDDASSASHRKRCRDFLS